MDGGGCACWSTIYIVYIMYIKLSKTLESIKGSEVLYCDHIAQKLLGWPHVLPHDMINKNNLSRGSTLKRSRLGRVETGKNQCQLGHEPVWIFFFPSWFGFARFFWIMIWVGPFLLGHYLDWTQVQSKYQKVCKTSTRNDLILASFSNFYIVFLMHRVG